MQIYQPPYFSKDTLIEPPQQPTEKEYLALCLIMLAHRRSIVDTPSTTMPTPPQKILSWQALGRYMRCHYERGGVEYWRSSGM